MFLGNTKMYPTLPVSGLRWNFWFGGEEEAEILMDLPAFHFLCFLFCCYLIKFILIYFFWGAHIVS